MVSNFFLKSWTSTGYFLSSTGSSVTNGRFGWGRIFSSRFFAFEEIVSSIHPPIHIHLFIHLATFHPSTHGWALCCASVTSQCYPLLRGKTLPRPRSTFSLAAPTQLIDRKAKSVARLHSDSHCTAPPTHTRIILGIMFRPLGWPWNHRKRCRNEHLRSGIGIIAIME